MRNLWTSSLFSGLVPLILACSKGDNSVPATPTTPPTNTTTVTPTTSVKTETQLLDSLRTSFIEKLKRDTVSVDLNDKAKYPGYYRTTLFPGVAGHDLMQQEVGEIFKSLTKQTDEFTLSPFRNPNYPNGRIWISKSTRNGYWNVITTIPGYYVELDYIKEADFKPIYIGGGTSGQIRTPGSSFVTSWIIYGAYPK